MEKLRENTRSLETEISVLRSERVQEQQTHNGELKRLREAGELLKRQNEEAAQKIAVSEAKVKHLRQSCEDKEGVYRQEVSKLSSQLSSLQSRLEARDISEFEDSRVFEPHEELLSPVSSDDENIESFNHQLREKVSPVRRYQETKQSFHLAPAALIASPSPATSTAPVASQSASSSVSTPTKPTSSSQQKHTATPMPAKSLASKPQSSKPKVAPKKDQIQIQQPAQAPAAANSATTGENVYRALFDYNGKVFPGRDLGFKKGALIVVVGDEEDGWW